MSDFQCPSCTSTSVQISNGSLICTQCGESEPLGKGIRLRYSYPSDWIKEQVAKPVTGFENSPHVKGMK